MHLYAHHKMLLMVIVHMYINVLAQQALAAYVHVRQVIYHVDL